MQFSYIITLTILLFNPLFAVGSPPDPSETLYTRTATSNSANSDSVSGVRIAPIYTRTEKQQHANSKEVIQANTLNERHKHNHEMMVSDVIDYTGVYRKREEEDEAIVVLEGMKEEHHGDEVTRVHKRHGHHHTTTTTAPPVSPCYGRCDCLAPVASISCAQSKDSARAVDVSRMDAFHRAAVHEHITTEPVQQAQQPCDAACQAAHRNQGRDTDSEDAGNDRSP